LQGVRQADPLQRELLKQLTPGRIREVERGAAVELEQVEGEEGRGRPGGRDSRRPAMRAKPTAQPLEVRMAIGPEAHQLTVQDHSSSAEIVRDGEAPGTRRCSLDPAVERRQRWRQSQRSCACMPSNFTSRAQSSPSGTVPGRANMGLTKAGNLTVWLTPRTLAAAGGERLCSGRPLGENAAYSDAGDAGYGDETTILAIV